jgi:hypothetical protein
VTSWGISSAGRALPWHGRGQGFEPPILHQIHDIGWAFCDLSLSESSRNLRQTLFPDRRPSLPSLCHCLCRETLGAIRPALITGAGAAANSLLQTRIESGSSQAAAHVTGAVALLLSVYEKISKAQPTANLKSLTAKQVQSALRISTQNTSAAWDTGFGSGVLDTAELIRRATGVQF